MLITTPVPRSFPARNGTRLCLRKSALLDDPTLRVRYPSSHPSAAKCSTGAFCDASGPLRVQVPLLLHKKKNSDTITVSLFFWCAKRDLNPYVRDTRPSNVPVCQFQHSRSTNIIIAVSGAFVKSFIKNYSDLMASCSYTASARTICTGVASV